MKARFPQSPDTVGFSIQPVPPALVFKRKNGDPFELKKFWKTLHPLMRIALAVTAAINLGAAAGWAYCKCVGL